MEADQKQHVVIFGAGFAAVQIPAGSAAPL
jgi:NADH dehydrogenase FAD-containing subunit